MQHVNSTKIDRFQAWYTNSSEFHRLKQEIFTHDQYYFETTNLTPTIIDAGAHIGLATLYFKKLYPQAHLIAIEPLIENFQLLEKNIWENRLDDVETHQLALAARAGEIDFYHDETTEQWFSTASVHPGSWLESQQTTRITVPARPLSDFLTQPIDFLKLDIEGAEQEVLLATGDAITRIKHLICEFHPHPTQSLETVLEFLHDHHFTTELWKDGKTVTRAPQHIRGLVLIEAHHALL